MNFYAFNIGDYAGATRHLSWDEDMAYRRMLDAYYSREAPLPLDRRQVYRLVGASEDRQRGAVDAVLVEFFEERATGWHNSRADEEIAKAGEKSEAQAEKRTHEKERQRRHRARRKELFDLLRQKGITPSFDASTKSLEDMVANAEPVTRDKMYGHKDQNEVIHGARIVDRDTHNVTPNTGYVTQYVPCDTKAVTPDATAINPNPNPNSKDDAAARARRRQIFDETEAALRSIPELTQHPIATNTVIAPIFGLVLDKGYDLHTQVIPSIRRQLASARKPIKGWGYFVDGIVQDATQPIATAGAFANGSHRQKPTRDETFAAIERRIQQLREAEP